MKRQAEGVTLSPHGERTALWDSVQLITDAPLTVTWMVWCTEPSWFRPVQR